MLGGSFAILAAAVALGTALALLHLRPAGALRRRAPAWPLGALHGTLGAAGLAVLLLALRGPPRGVLLGVGPFGMVAAVLFGAALATGLTILATLRLRRQPGVFIAVHATIAVSGFVILAAYVLAG